MARRPMSYPRAETNQPRKYPDRGPGNYLKVTSALVRESLRARET